MSAAKKSIDSLNLEKVSAILLDVAGTTTAISFVKETLFPYVIKHAEEFLKTSWEDEEIKKAVSQFEEKDLDVTKAGEIVKTLTEKDDTNIGLKTIQGLLFKKGYENGELKGHIFDDVAKSIESWAKTKKLAVFSSGSIESQQLLFKNTSEGDLSQHISNFFDQSFGPKTEADSYKKIAKEMGVSPDNILFLTDDIKEAEAAKSANLLVALIEREGNASIPDDKLLTFAMVKSFADIPLENIKRKIEEESVEEPPSKIAKTEENIVAKTEENTETKIETETVEAKVPAKEEETKKTEEKCEEAMEVDVDEEKLLEKKDETPESSVAEKSSDIEIPEKSTKKVDKANEGKPSTEDKAELMDVCDTVVTETATTTEKDENKEKLTNKTETQPEAKSGIEIGTQTKTVTNECETQTTIKGITNNESLEVKEANKNETLENDKMETTVSDSKAADNKCDKLEETGAVINNLNEENKVIEIKKTIEKKECDKLQETATKMDKSKEEENKVEKTPEENTEKCLNETKAEENVKNDEKTKETESKETKVIAETECKETEVAEKSDCKETEIVKKTECQKSEIVEKTECKKPETVEKTECKKIEIVEKLECKETEETEIVEKPECKEPEVVEKTECKQIETAEKQKETNGNEDKKEIVEATKEKIPEVTEQSTETVEVVPKENGVSQEKSDDKVDKVEEKENKSELANGTENGVANGESSDTSNGVEEKEDEIKVKLIDDKVDGAAVSVEA